MSKWATPVAFESDGCTWPTLLNDLLGRDRNKQFCRRHDFECRHSTHSWKEARDYMLKGIKEHSPKATFKIFGKEFKIDFFAWRRPLIWAGLTVVVSPCRDYHTELPLEWENWRNREYEE